MRNGPTTDLPGVKIAALARYLPTVLDDYDAASDLAVKLLTGDRSNLTCLLSHPGGPQWELRRPPLGHVMPSAHDMSREFRALSGLAGTGFPAPRPRALCTDHSVLGVTFLIYDYSSGQIIADETAAQRLSSAQADHVCGELIDTLVRLHGIEPPPAPPGRSVSAADYPSRQVARWIDQWQHTHTRQLVSFDPLARWLQDEISGLPADYDVTLVHGDYRLDNLVLDPDTQEVRVVLDWEMSTLGDPLMDLALLLVYWERPADGLRHQVNVARNLTTADGFWSREQLVSAYAQATTRRMDRLQACLGLACLKLAVVMESIHYRYLSGHALDSLSAGLADATPALLEMGLAVAAGQGLAGLTA